MLAATEPGVRTVTAMTCTQVLKTALLENVFGFYAHLDPCPILLLQPKEDAAEQFSKERIAPMVKVTPVLKRIVGTSKTRASDETLLFKAFPGGFLALAGAGSPDNVARRPIRVLLCDEVDKYPITKEGPVIPLAEERLATFSANSLSVRACSPTVEDESEIASSYDASDQRRASVECPHCQHRQFLDFFKHVEWPKDDRGIGRPEVAAIHCEACGSAWSEGERLRALQTTRWHQTRSFVCCGERHNALDDYAAAWRDGDATPDAAVGAVWDWWQGPRHAVYRARCPHCAGWPVSNEHAGFTASKLFSPWSRDTPAHIARKYLAAKQKPDLLQSFWNTQLGLPFRLHSGKTISAEALAARGEMWDAEIPDGVAVLTAGVDVQDDRIEIEVVGWGRNEESWSVHYEVIEGDPDTAALWDRVDAFLKRKWFRADGRPFAIRAACLDSGGHHTQRVYSFAKARLGRKIWAIKGESAVTGERNPVWPTKRPTSRTKASFRPIILGVNAAKDTIRARLAIEKPDSKSDAPVPGYMHTPADRDLNWYAQLIAERATAKVVGARRFRVWELIPGRRNEALDCRVYAYGALCGLQHFGMKLNVQAERVAGPPTAEEVAAALAAVADAALIEPAEAQSDEPAAPPAPARPAPAVPPPPPRPASTAAASRPSRWAR